MREGVASRVVRPTAPAVAEENLKRVEEASGAEPIGLRQHFGAKRGGEADRLQRRRSRTTRAAGGTAIDSAYRRVLTADCNELRSGDRRGMERIEPTPEPPDRDGVPRTLLAFTCAVLFVVAEVVLLPLVETAWAVVFAIASVVGLLVLVLWAIELDIRPHAARRRELRGAPVLGRTGAPVRPSPPATWSGPPGHRRVLLVASERVGAAALTPLVAGHGADTAVLVVAPALQPTRLDYWIADSDEPIERARQVQQATVAGLLRAHIPSNGHVGSRDPVTAIEDALRFFDADEIVLALHTHGQRRYGERHLRAEVEQRFQRPTVELEPQHALAPHARQAGDQLA